MSLTWRKYKINPKYKRQERFGNGNKDMTLTATVQGEEMGSAVQFTIGDKYAVLSGKQIKELINQLERRINGEVSATAWEDDEEGSVDFVGNLDEDDII